MSREDLGGGLSNEAAEALVSRRGPAGLDIEAHRFSTFEAAFSACRDADRPMTVYIAGERYRVFPSGRAEPSP